ncbi:unnamed protein product, partial [Pylaiella littoralis]
PKAPAVLAAALVRPGKQKSINTNNFHHAIGHRNAEIFRATAKQLGALSAAVKVLRGVLRVLPWIRLGAACYRCGTRPTRCLMCAMTRGFNRVIPTRGFGGACLPSGAARHPSPSAHAGGASRHDGRPPCTDRP